MAGIGISVDVRSVVNNLNSMHADCELAIKRTISDVKARSPAWISKAVRKEYNIKKADIPAPSITGGDSGVESIELHYKGRMLTPVHFSMRPASRPSKQRGYYISLSVTKGRRQTLHGKHDHAGKPFLASNGGTGQIPFQRRTTESNPIDAIRSISVPQMISSESPENVKPEIMAPLMENINKRYKHHEDALKKKYGMT